MNKELDLIDVFPVSQLSETEKAYKFLYMGEQKWIPKSITTVKRRDQDGKITHIQVPEWFYEKEGFES